MPSFELYDSFTLSLEGDGSVYNRINATLRPFQTTSIDNADLTVTSIADLGNPEVDAVLGGPEEHYAATEDKFVFQRYGEPIIINDDLTSITCAADAPPDIVRLLVEWKVRQRFIDDGLSMVHGSAVKHEGETIVFPAWRHTGKTNTMLTFLAEGASYLADDRLFVGSDGTVRGYPTDLHFLSYNYRSFPDIAPDSSISKFRSSLSKKISSITSSNSSKISKGINVINDAVIAEDHWRDVQEIFPETSVVFEDELDRIVMLRTTTQSKPYIESIEPDELADSLYSINYREWDRDLLEFGSAHRALSGEQKLFESITNVIDEQRTIFERLPKTAKIDILYVPDEEYWSRQTKRRIISLIT